MKRFAAFCCVSSILLVSSVTLAAVPGAMLRVVCEDGDKGAEVSVDGKFKGECPVDIMLTEGAHKVRVSKPVGSTQEQLFEQDVRLGDGTSKRIDVVLSQPQMNAAARRAANAANSERQRKAEVRLTKLIKSASTDPQAASELARYYFIDSRSCYLFMPNPGETVSWSGPCRDGIASGNGEVKFEANGVVTARYVGPLVAGWADGQGALYLKGGEEYRGDFVEGFRAGHGKQVLSNGVFEGEFARGLRNGRGVYSWNTGDRYDGNWVDGKRQGSGDLLTSDGYRYIGDFASNMRHGNGVVIAPDGTRKEGRYENDERVGPTTIKISLASNSGTHGREIRHQNKKGRTLGTKKLAVGAVWAMNVRHILALSCTGLIMVSAQTGAQDLLRMSEQLDRVDKGDFQEALSKASQCTRMRDYTCAETQLKNARKFSTDSKSKSALKRAEDDLLAERAREKEEQRLAAQRQLEQEKRETELRQAEQRARDAERQAQAEAEERENINNRIAAAGNAYSQTLRAQANARAAEQARNQQFAQQQADAERNVANEQRRQAQERSQMDSQRAQLQRQADAQRIQLAQAQQDSQRAQAAAAAAKSAPVSQPVREIAPSATPQKKSNSINTGREAMHCVSVSREKDDLGFTNNCNIQIFVVWCGNLKYSKKQCGDGPVGNSFYTHSVNVGPGDKQYARGVADFHYAACEGGIGFGKDEIQDRPDGTFTCVPK